MSTGSKEVTLERVADFHTQLIRLHDAGIAFDLADNTDSARQFKDRLDQILAHFATERKPGKSLEDVLLKSPQASARYRAALITWVRSGGSVEALTALHRPAMERLEVTSDYRLALVQPQIIAVLVYGATIFMLLGVAANLESIYQQVRLPPSWPLRWVLAVRDALPIWGPGVPIVFVLFRWWLARGALAKISWLPGRRAALKTLSAGQYATNLSNLMQHDTSGDEALAIVGPWSPTVHASSQFTSSTVPPVLRWALAKIKGSSDTVGGITPSNAGQLKAHEPLQFAAGLYDTMQRYQVEKRRTWLPLVLGLAFGGTLVLLYGLALFGPMAELLKDLVKK